MKIRTLIATCFACVGLGTGASAATAVFDPATGFVVGYNDLDVGGVNLYTTLHFGSYNDVYGAGTPYFLGDAAGAELAADALVLALNTMTPTAPELAYPKVAYDDSEIVWVPSGLLVGDEFRAKQAGHNSNADPYQRFGDFVGKRDTNYSFTQGWVFAKFSRTPLPIPEVPPQPIPLPASGFLLIGAALGLGGLRLTRR